MYEIRFPIQFVARNRGAVDWHARPVSVKQLTELANTLARAQGVSLALVDRQPRVRLPGPSLDEARRLMRWSWFWVVVAMALAALLIVWCLLKL